MKVHTLDLMFQDAAGVIAAYLVESGGEVALIETGPGSTLHALCAGIATAGFRLEQVKKVFVTHVHLDHAGAAGWWAGQGAKVYCHPRAHRHLIDPGRLIGSAKQVYGEAFDALWGEMVPAPEEQVQALQDGESVPLGNETVTAHETSGHARHHHAFAVGNVCFTGDVAGVRLGGSSYQSVAAAPPQFELDAYLNSVHKLKGFGFQRLYLTHFGGWDDVEAHLNGYERRLRQVADDAVRSLACGETEGEWRNRFSQNEQGRAFAQGCAPAEWDTYQLANGTAMCADGLRLWAGGV